MKCASLSIYRYPRSDFVLLKVPKMCNKKPTHKQPYGMCLIIVLSEVLGCNGITEASMYFTFLNAVSCEYAHPISSCKGATTVE